MELLHHKYLKIIGIGALTSDWILMNLPPFESSHRDDSNGTCFIFLGSILMELLHHKYLKIIGIKALSGD